VFFGSFAARNQKVMHGKNVCNVEEILVAAKNVERVLGELGETPFEPFKEK
jgi:hypothetical protein